MCSLGQLGDSVRTVWPIAISRPTKKNAGVYSRNGAPFRHIAAVSALA
jgi:hypothetical protein